MPRSTKTGAGNYNTGGGQLMDWWGINCDIAHWGLVLTVVPAHRKLKWHGEISCRRCHLNTSTRYRIELGYRGNITMTMAGGYDDIR